MVEPISGRALAEAAHLHTIHKDRYRSGVEIPDLVRELEASGIRVSGDDPWMTLRSALNGAQDLWVLGEGSHWIAVDAVRAVGTEVSGMALADIVYAHVVERYPRERTFHYEEAKEQLLRKGVRIKGPVTGRTIRSALVGSPDRFETVGRGMWRWKAVSR